MPPEVHYYCSFATPLVKFKPPSSPEAEINKPVGHKNFEGAKSMKFPRRKFMLPLVLVLSSISILRLIQIAITTSFPAPPLSALPPNLHESGSSTTQPKSFVPATHLSKKEFKLLSKLVRHKAPCNLLIFGLERQHVKLSSINADGITVFLEDDPQKMTTIRAKSNTTLNICKVDYQIPAKKAYKLLKHARESPACAPGSGMLQNSSCKLALTTLPEEVYKVKWDIVVVDGPSGHSPEAPGRMAVIYTASMIARAGNATDVVVHDVHRTIEKWFSWEFLCDENLVSSKGRLWNFRITGKSTPTRFCTDK